MIEMLIIISESFASEEDDAGIHIAEAKDIKVFLLELLLNITMLMLILIRIGSIKIINLKNMI